MTNHRRLPWDCRSNHRDLKASLDRIKFSKSSGLLHRKFTQMSPFAGFQRAFYGHPGRWALSTAKSLAFCHVVWNYGFSVGPASGPSMLPTFSVDGDWLLVSKKYRNGRDVRVGDLVVYRIPVEPGDEAVKRVMGMPGDYVLVNSPEGASDLMIQVRQAMRL